MGSDYYVQVCLHAEGQRVHLKEKRSNGEIGKDSHSHMQVSIGASACRMGWLQGQNQLMAWKSTCCKIIHDG